MIILGTNSVYRLTIGQGGWMFGFSATPGITYRVKIDIGLGWWMIILNLFRRSWTGKWREDKWLKI